MPLSILNEPTLGDILATATTTSSFGAEVLETDPWVVWTLQALFGDPDLGHLLGFKGGTNLSKAPPSRASASVWTSPSTTERSATPSTY